MVANTRKASKPYQKAILGIAHPTIWLIFFMDDTQNRQPLQSFPKKIMHDLHWSFHYEKYQSRSDFDLEVRQYEIEITGIESWKPNEIVLQYPRVGIEYFRGKDGFAYEEFIEIESDNGKFFTASELLFKVHNTICEEVQKINHHFFEGFNLKSIRSGDNLPVYELCQGS